MESHSAFEIIILDIDGSVLQQERLLSQLKPTVIPLQEKSADFRYWCSREEMVWLQHQLLDSFQTSKPKILLYGSGDYHHLAYLGLSLIEQPVTVIQFDNHADFWREYNPRLFHFGRWVIEALRLPHVRKVIQLGVDGDLRTNWNIPFPLGKHSHDFDLLLNGKLEIYPYHIKRTRYLGRMQASLLCVEFRPSFVTTQAMWKNIADSGGVLEILKQILSSIPIEGVYITIDKDVMIEQDNFAAYRERQGCMRLEELLSALSMIAAERQVLGADICGDGSILTRFRSPLKKFWSWNLYKKIPVEEFTSPANIRLNENANLSIIERLDPSLV